MPIYDLTCIDCGKKLMDVFVHSYKDKVKCPRCRGTMKRVVPKSSKFIGAKCFPAEGIYLEHVSTKGKTFYSEKEMRDFEKKTGMEIARLH